MSRARGFAALAVCASVVPVAAPARGTLHLGGGELGGEARTSGPVAVLQGGVAAARWPAPAREVASLRGSLEVPLDDERTLFASVMSVSIASARVSAVEPATTTSALYLAFGPGLRYAGRDFGVAGYFGYGFTYFGSGASDPRFRSASGPMIAAYPHVFLLGEPRDALRIGVGIPLEAKLLAPWFTLAGVSAFAVF